MEVLGPQAPGVHGAHGAACIMYGYIKFEAMQPCCSHAALSRCLDGCWGSYDGLGEIVFGLWALGWGYMAIP